MFSCFYKFSEKQKGQIWGAHTFEELRIVGRLSADPQNTKNERLPNPTYSFGPWAPEALTFNDFGYVYHPLRIIALICSRCGKALFLNNSIVQ